MYGLSLVWVRLCLGNFHVFAVAQPRPGTSHLYGFSVVGLTCAVSLQRFLAISAGKVAPSASASRTFVAALSLRDIAAGESPPASEMYTFALFLDPIGLPRFLVIGGGVAAPPTSGDAGSFAGANSDCEVCQAIVRKSKGKIKNRRVIPTEVARHQMRCLNQWKDDDKKHP